ncbi:MAG: choice-of-anchor Q domain-containing protein, partial [Planctomycetota bacterium]
MKWRRLLSVLWVLGGMLVYGAVPAAQAQTCSSPIALSCNMSTGIQTTDMTNDESSYSCTGTDFQGADVAFVMREPAGTEIFVTMRPPEFSGGPPESQPNVDMLIVEDTCETGPCVAYAPQPNGVREWAIDEDNDGIADLAIDSDGGDYFVHVDVDQPVGNWPFKVDTYCNTCDPAAAEKITCSSDLLGETTAGGTSSMNYYTCGTPSAPLAQLNAERIYEFTPQGSGSVTFTLDNMTSDFDIYVLEDLCRNNSCLTGNTGPSINVESITFTATAGVTYYIVVEDRANGGGTYDLFFEDNTGGCLEDCDDGIDNDLDGPIDCADTDCAGDPACLAEDCFNGVDDDLDGQDDCTDLDCPDADADGVNDFCDLCPGGDDTIDTDGDGVPDDCEGTCGNGIAEAGEECDDGNTADGDCCSSICAFEPAESPCDDGDAATVNDVCDGAGACAGGTCPTGPYDVADGDVQGLIDAIYCANMLEGADTINLATGGTYVLTAVDNEANNSPNGLPSITSEITIEGNGATVGRDAAAPNFRMLHVASDGIVTIYEITLAGGNLDEDEGGGILNSGTLTLTDSTVSGNSARSGAGITNRSNATLTLTNSTVSGNAASTVGGGIENHLCSAGLGCDAVTVNLLNSTISGNSAGEDGGGIYNALNATLTLTNSTVSGNSAGELGGGIYNVSFNIPMTLSNSIVADSPSGGDCGGGGDTTDNGFNIVEDGSCISASTSMSGDPNLGSLADNGGPTQTHALLEGSIAIDAITDLGACTLDTDQRGVPRPQGDACDIGSFEVEDECGPDSDGDGVGDACDVCQGFDDTLDADGDGVPNGCDICPGFNDALDADTDGVPDGCDVCPGPNDANDADGDGVPDGCDICPGFDDAADGDGDGVPNGCDICPGFNDAADADGDGVPNGCDICPGFDDAADADGDGVPNGCD